MLRLILFISLLIFVFNGCLKGPAGPSGESTVDTLYINTGSPTGYMYDTLFVCPQGIDSTYFIDLGLAPSIWFVNHFYTDEDLGDTTSAMINIPLEYTIDLGFQVGCAASYYVIESFHIYYSP